VPFTTPIVLITFTREHTTRRTMERIRAIAPQRLYVIADGARADVVGEKEACERARSVALEVDWECEVLTNFASENLGVEHRLPSGLDWVFEREERAIIFEDDCLPELSFFPFCEELLTRYADDEKVMAISGFCPDEPNADATYSYGFQQLFVIWGWATWRRAWQQYRTEYPVFTEALERDQHFLPAVVKTENERRLWSMIASGQIGRTDWSLKWLMSMFLRGGVQISPTVNLVQSIGFEPGAANMRNDPFDGRSSHSRPIEFPLSHPTDREVNVSFDRAVLDAMLSQVQLPSRWNRNVSRALGRWRR
jgi:hypothetical protein